MSKKHTKEPQFLPSPLNNPMVNYKVYVMSLKEKIVYFVLSLALGGAAGLVFYGGLFKDEGDPTTATYISNFVIFIGVGLIASKFAIPAITDMLINRRAKKLRKQFIDLLETISTLLTSGSTVNDAFIQAGNDLKNQYTETDMIIVELNEIVQGVSNGITLEEMLDDFGARSNNKDIQNFSNVISNCFRLGGNFKDVVRRTRDVISEKVQIEEEIATKISSNKIQLNAMTLMPVVLVGMLKMSSGTFADNLSSFVGVLVTTIAIVLFVVAYFWGQKIIDIS